MKIVACCGCAHLKFESDSEPVLTLCCHCLDCQDALQADFANIAFFSVGSVEMQGAPAEKHYVAASGSKTIRQYCPHCNTVMFDRSEGFPHLLGVMANQILPPYSFSPACHVFVRDKKPAVEIPEGVKQYEMGLS
tara:strand:- start:353 stop:757 length:405 start_codon:yes stop_codon:yes gene_type:complete